MKKSGFLEGTIIATVAIIITKILGMLYVIPFYAMVGVTGSALYAYAYNIYVIFLDISSAGIPSAMSKIIKEYNTLGLLDAKVRAYELAKKLITFISVASFIILFVFAPLIAELILGELSGGNTIEDVTFVIRCVSFAILIIPFLSVTKGYLQGHNIINVSSISQVIEQVIRIAIILGGSYLGLNVLNLSLRTTVGIAVFGAFIGGLTAILYIWKNIRSHKKELSLDGNVKKDNVTNEEIKKKIITYAVPFIIVDVALSIYSFIDMVFISRTMTYLGLDAHTTEFITTSITTWSGKISMVVNSIAMGLTISLIPNIVEAYTLKKWHLVEDKLNKALEIILAACIPMVIGISMLAKPIWSIFYGTSDIDLGGLVLSIYIFTPLFFNLYVITSSTLQSCNRFKLVYITTLLGYITNAILDVPLMLLCHALNLPAFAGACMASAIGYCVSVLTALYMLKKDYHLKYKDTLKTFMKILFPTIIMVAVVYGLRLIVPLDIYSKTSCIIYVAIISIIGAIVYITISYKQGLLTDIFGKEYLNKIIKKLTFNKVSIN